MHAAYSKLNSKQVLAILNKLVPDIAKIWPMPSLAQARASLLELARTTTGRDKLLVLSDPAQPCLLASTDLAYIPAGNAGQLCLAIAGSDDRLAGLVVEYTQASPFYYKKVRELSSAEGAVMIWDTLATPLLQAEKSVAWTRNSQPDLVGFQLDEVIWLGAKQDMLGAE